MPAEFEMKQGDTLPELFFTCVDANGPVDISAALTVTFHANKGGTVAINRPVTIIDDGTLPLRGKGKVEWIVADTDTELGLYEFEIEADWGGGKTLTFPNGKINPKLQINKQLA